MRPGSHNLLVLFNNYLTKYETIILVLLFSLNNKKEMKNDHSTID